MKKPPPTTLEPQASSTWERLEDFVREHVQRFTQSLLEEEVTVAVHPSDLRKC